jgi:NADH dehydrogenase FAD-containing subunit
MADIISDGIANANNLREHFEIKSLEQTSSIPSKGGESIIIIGAGAFGTSLALELATNYDDKWVRR